MGTIPKPLLALVAAILGLCVVAGLTLGILPSLRHGAANDDEAAPLAAASDANSGGIKDAQALAEPPPLPAKAKAAPAASDSPASDAAPAVAKPAVAAPPPTESPPGAPSPPTPAKLPNDLPPT